MSTFAVDPDLHRCAWALADGFAGTVSAVGVWRVPEDLRGDAALARMIRTVALEFPVRREQVRTVRVEVPVIQARGTSRPTDILRLGEVAAAAAAAALAAWPGADLELVTPSHWKGSVPKAIHQARTCRRVGWECKQLRGHARPELPDQVLRVLGADGLRSGDWRHVLDAVGLAVWSSK